MKSFRKNLKRVVISRLISFFSSILNAQYIDTKWTVTGYFGELWYEEEKDILGKKQEFFKGWANGFFILVITQVNLKHIIPIVLNNFLRTRNLN